MSNRTATLGAGAVGVVAIVAAAAFACTSLSHVNDYTVEEKLLCTACNRADLCHVSCPPPLDTDTAQSIPPLDLPLRQIGFGADTRSLAREYRSGLDQNCAPTGEMTCGFQSFADASVPVVPVGVDNELGATVFAHLLDH